MNPVGTGVAIGVSLMLAACSFSPMLIPRTEQYSAQVQPLPAQSAALVYFYNQPQFIFHPGLFVSTSTVTQARYAILRGGQSGKELATLGCGHSIHICSGTYTWRYLSAGTYDLTVMFIQHHGNGIRRPVDFQSRHTYYFAITQSAAAYAQNIRLHPVLRSQAVLAMQRYMYCRGNACDIPHEDHYDKKF